MGIRLLLERGYGNGCPLKGLGNEAKFEIDAVLAHVSWGGHWRRQQKKQAERRSR
jgi:hypothetical protein